MKCPVCGSELKDGETFCTVCGKSVQTKEKELEQDNLDEYEEVEEIDIDDFKDPIYTNEVELLDDEEPVYEDVSFDDEENDLKHYLEIFIGEDYHWIAKRIINPYAFLLSWMYFLYRKLYFIGIIGLIITGIVVRIYPKYLLFYVLIVMFSSGLFFNIIYRMIAKRKVKRIMKKYDDTALLEEECERKGGVNTPKALLIFLIFLAILFSTYLHIHTGESKPNFWKENNENKANCILMSKKAHAMIDKEIKMGTLDSSVCHVVITNAKNYDIYLKIVDEANETYYYFKNNGKYLTVEGDTSKISQWEKALEEKSIIEEEKTMLEVSKKIENQFQEMIQISNQEEDLIEKRKNTTERLYYYLKKDDIYR